MEIKISHLGIIAMDERNTAPNLHQKIKSLLLEYGLDMSQIYSVTTDNGEY